MRTLPFVALAAIFAPFAALAVGPTDGLSGGLLTYEVFEVSVDHADLATCPEGFDNEEVFCRLTLANEMAHVFVFAYEGDQPLMGVKSYELEEGILNLQ